MTDKNDNPVIHIDRVGGGGLKISRLDKPPLPLSDRCRDFSRIAKELRESLETPGDFELDHFADGWVKTEGLIRLDGYQINSDLPYLLPVFRGCWEFLSTGDRETTLHAELALVLSAWQWYGACKACIAMLKFGPNDEIEKGIYIDELARAYAALTRILWDLRYTRVIRILMKRMGIEPQNALSDSMRREMLLLSTVLTPRNPKQDELGMGMAFTPFNAEQILLPTWNQLKLLSTFHEDLGGRAAVRRLIVETLLPRYNFIDALHLARLARRAEQSVKKTGAKKTKSNTPNGEKTKSDASDSGKPESGKPASEDKPQTPENLWWKLLPPLAACWLLALATLAGGTSLLTLGDSNSAGFWLVVGLQNLLWLALPVATLVYLLDWRVLANFALPRVIGGVSIGFLTIALQGESAIKVANAIWTRGPALVLLMIAAVLLVGFAYLFFDALPLTGDYWRAAGRAGMALGATASIAALGGLLVTAVTSAAYWSELVDVGWMNHFLLGPFGWFSAGQFLVFTPMALLTGLLTQFIFEDLTLPASVWSPEE